MSVIVCHACDLAHRGGAIIGHGRVRCVRCGAELYRTSGASLDFVLALLVSALVLFLLSNLYPLVDLRLNGATRTTTLAGAAVGLYEQGYVSIAALVFVTTICVPLAQILSLMYLLLPMRAGRRAPAQNELFRALVRLRPWAMSEVFMLGALVAVVKLSAMAQVIPGISLFCYGALMMTLAGVTSITPTEQFWQWAESGHR